MDLNKINEFLKTPLGILIAGVIAIIILYYVTSPYQNCKRNMHLTEDHKKLENYEGVLRIMDRKCLEKTSW